MQSSSQRSVGKSIRLRPNPRVQKTLARRRRFDVECRAVTDNSFGFWKEMILELIGVPKRSFNYERS
jgi:hypothetical protein